MIKNKEFTFNSFTGWMKFNAFAVECKNKGVIIGIMHLFSDLSRANDGVRVYNYTGNVPVMDLIMTGFIRYRVAIVFYTL